MVHPSVIQARLNQLGVKVSYWYKPELKELSLLLMDDEEIVSLVTGRYYGGYAMLVATGQRLLLIDKKTMFMSLEDIRFDMVSQINYSSRLMDATIVIYTVNKQHRFTSVKHRAQMRELTTYVQRRIMEIRQPQTMQQLVRTIDDAEESTNEPETTEAQGQRAVSLPSPKSVSLHLRSVGTAAIKGAHLSAINPYTNGSLSMKSSWSGRGTPASAATKPVSQLFLG